MHSTSENSPRHFVLVMYHLHRPLVIIVLYCTPSTSRQFSSTMGPVMHLPSCRRGAKTFPPLKHTSGSPYAHEPPPSVASIEIRSRAAVEVTPPESSDVKSTCLFSFPYFRQFFLRFKQMQPYGRKQEESSDEAGFVSRACIIFVFRFFLLSSPVQVVSMICKVRPPRS